MSDTAKGSKASAWMPSVSELVVSGLCALCFAMAFRYVVDGECPLSFGLAADAIVYWICFLTAFVIGRRIMTLKPKSGQQPKVLHRAYQLLAESKHPVLLGAVVISLFWAPIIILMYPGTICYDTVHMLVMYRTGPGGGYFSAHHPVFDTLLYGGVIVSIADLTGSWRLGVFSFTLLQMVGTAAAFSYALKYVRVVLKASETRFLVLLAFICLFPFFPLFATYLSKDSLFSAFFILFMVEFMELVRTRGTSLSSAGAITRFVVICLLCCLTKKLGMYIVIGSLLVAVIVIRRHMLKVLICTLAIAALMIVVFPAVISAAGISSGGKQEALSLMFQQTARCARDHPDDVTPEEREAIDELLDYDTLVERYQFDSADPIKGYMQLATKPDSTYAAYLKAWFSQGLRHPITYFEAAAALNSHWFAFERIDPLLGWDWNPMFNDLGIDPSVASRPSLTSRTTEFVSYRYYFLCALPIISVMFTFGLWATLLPSFALSVLLRRRCLRYLLAFVPIALSIMMGLWLSPTALGPGNGIRYLIPLIYAMSFVLSWCRFALTGGDADASDDNPSLAGEDAAHSIERHSREALSGCAE